MLEAEGLPSRGRTVVRLQNRMDGRRSERETFLEGGACVGDSSEVAQRALSATRN